MKSNYGFTLIELLIVVSVLANIVITIGVGYIVLQFLKFW